MFSLVALASATLVGHLASSRSFLGRVLEVPPLVWLGTISYGVYLWHWPMQHVVNELGVPLSLRLPVVALLTIPAAAASFYAVERPLQRRWRHTVTVGTKSEYVSP